MSGKRGRYKAYNKIEEEKEVFSLGAVLVGTIVLFCMLQTYNTVTKSK